MLPSFFNQISILDWTIFFLTIALTLLAVLYGNAIKSGAKKEKITPLETLLMGRQLTLPFFVATLVATWYGGIFGVTEITFKKGIYNFITQGVFWYLTYILFALFLVKRIRKFEAITLPELLGKMFGPRSVKVGAVFTFLNILPVSYVISLGLFLQVLFGGSLLFMMFLGLIFVLLYTSVGGFRSVVYSDLIQFFVMCLGVLIVLIFSVTQYGGLSFLQMNLPAYYFNPTSDEGWLLTLVWGFIALGTLVDPSFYQRAFAAKTDKIAQKGILISTLIWFCFDICTTAGALYARATLPDAAPGQAYMLYALNLLPDGFRGLFLAGILATILSTLTSFLFIATTTISYDLIPNKKKYSKVKHHLSALTAAGVTLLLATMFDGSIKSVWKTLGSYASACLLAPMLLGHLFPGKIKDNQFVLATLTGAFSLSLAKYYKTEEFSPLLDPFYLGLCGTTFGLVSYMAYHYGRKKFKQRLS